MYLAVSQTGVSLGLTREGDEAQKPVYYTSQAFKGVEAWYRSIKKMVFTMIIASQKLRPYFQAHSIIMLIDQPITKAMNKLDAAGWLVLWAIELGKFNVKCRPQTAIKAQALANFIAEFTLGVENNEDEAWWKIKVDGSSNKDAGVKVVLESPEKDVIQYAIQLQFPSTNNDAEYEALLTGLKLAKSIGA